MTIARTMGDNDLKLVAPPELTRDQQRGLERLLRAAERGFRQAGLKGNDLVRWKYNRYLHDYLGCIKAVDESVGRLLAFLDEEGLAGDTHVVYAADQGFYLGEHGWFDKRWIFEESLRTPLLVRWPGVVKPGGKSDRIVSNLDFAETFLEAAGLPVPAEMQGRSLLPLLAGTGAGRLADEPLLSLLRVSRAPQCAQALRRCDRPLQARPFLRAGSELLGAIRSGDRPARADERFRHA